MGIELPENMQARPLASGDLDAVLSLTRLCEASDDGAALTDRSDIESAWSRPGFDPSTMSTGVWQGEELVACAEVFLGRAVAVVAPEVRGLGVGSALARWTWDVARADGRERVGQTVGERNEAATRLFRTLGYEPTHTSWILRLELPEAPPPPALVEPYSFRDFRAGTDDREVYRVIDTAFNEWPMRDAESFDDWRAETLDRDEALERLQVVVVDGSDRIVGAAVNYDYASDDEGWTEQLAVDARCRGAGLGKAMMIESFRRFHELGRRRCGVSTDSRTGALDFYLALGMRVTDTYVRWTKAL